MSARSNGSFLRFKPLDEGCLQPLELTIFEISANESLYFH